MDGIPARFDHAPAVPVIERVLPWSELQPVCFGLVAKYNSAVEAQAKRALGFSGCSGIAGDGKCYVWRIDDDDVRRHELAHCNGWGRGHER